MKDLLKVFEVLHEANLTAEQTISMLKQSLELQMSSALEKEEFDSATELNKVLVSLTRLSYSI
mgnify:CR=1 FL=1